MKITKSGTYIFENKNIDKLEVCSGITSQIFFDNVFGKIDLIIGENSKVDFYSINNTNSDFDLNIFQFSKNTIFNSKSLFLGFEFDISSNIISQISGENNSAEIQIFGITNNQKLLLNSQISVLKNAKNTLANLSQKNTFIGKTGTISGTPQLFVASKDVKASHSCKIERLNPNLIFYLMSRGLSEKEAVNLMIGNIINGVVGSVKEKNGY